MLPNFLIVGAHKGASTSLHHYAGEHPQVYMSPQKETRFFIADFYRRLPADYPADRREYLLKQAISTLEDYEAQFAGVRDEIAVGEATPQYLYLYEMAIPGIRKVLGAPKIAMILRDPVERAYSAWRMINRNGGCPPSFEAFIEREPEYVAGNWPPAFHAIHMGFYARQVRAWREAFPDVLVLLHDEMVRDPGALMARFYAWLGVDPGFRPNLSERHNDGGASAPMAPETRARLRALYREDTLRLQDDLGIDLSAWLG